MSSTPPPAKSPTIVAPATPRLPFPVVRDALPLRAPFDWLRAGWADFRACAGASLFYGACFSAAGWLLVLAFRYAVHLLSGLTAGFMLVGPFLAIGLYALSRERERGEVPRLRPTLSAWKTTRGAVGIYSVILIIIYLIWARASLVVFALFYDGGMPSLGGFITEIARLDDLEFILTYVVLGAAFALLVFALSVVSIPLMLDRDQDAISAMIVSTLALVRNLPVLMLWAMLIIVLIGAGIATGFVGLLVTGPWVGHATWHAFRALVEPLPENTGAPA